MKQSTSSREKELGEFGPETNGLRSKVLLKKDFFSVGEAVHAKYVVKNVSNRDQTVWHSGFWPNHLIIIKRADGKEPALTDYGNGARAAFAPSGSRRKHFPVTLRPGAEDNTEGSYDLSTIYDLSKPSFYTVQYIYEERQTGWEGRLVSNVVPFQIISK